MKRYNIVGICAVTLAIGGCAGMSDTQRHTATGAGVGAAAGAAIGAVTAGGNRGKSTATGAAIGAAAGAAGGYIWSRRMEQQKAEMEQATAGTDIEIERTADNQIRVNIPSDAGFDVGRSAIKSQLGGVLDKFAAGMRNNAATKIRIVGHTDSTGSDAINNPLSRDRAISTRDYLAARGVAASRITTDGRGSYEPVASNNTASGRAENRRVEIFVGEVQQAG